MSVGSTNKWVEEDGILSGPQTKETSVSLSTDSKTTRYRAIAKPVMTKDPKTKPRTGFSPTFNKL